MTRPVPSVAGAEWLARPGVRRIFALLDGDGETVRAVGGAVRNTLIGMPVGDVDFATTALPQEVVRRASAAGINAVPTGIEHGTVTLVIDGAGYEVTTLREDVETDGRHAVVRFGRDYARDAERRDFTLNALYADGEGTVLDPLGGWADLAARRIRFIGDADRRIAEDRLRILRFFRFNAEYGRGPLDPDGMRAVTRAHDTVRVLSAERVGQEMRRLVVAGGAADAAGAMQECGVLPVVLGGIGYVAGLTRLADYERETGLRPTAALRLAVLGCRVAEDAERLVARLRLSNAERDRMAAAIDAASSFRLPPSRSDLRAAVYRRGGEAVRDGLALSAAWAGGIAERATLDRDAAAWTPPRFPLSGEDVLALGPRGAAVGTLLRTLEAWWIAEDFRPTAAELRARLQAIVAGQQ